MSRFVDLSHVVYDGMPGIRLKRPDGTLKEGTARIRTWLGREAMSDILQGQAAFEVTELSLPTPIGTYIDSPFNRFTEGRDISEPTLDELILPGVVLDLREHPAGEPVPGSALPADADLKGAAVLCNFGRDRQWGKPAYDDYPYLKWSNARKPALVIGPGDTVTFENIDATCGQITTKSTAEDIRNLDFDRVNPIAGPVYIDGAEPGDALPSM